MSNNGMDRLSRIVNYLFFFWEGVGIRLIPSLFMTTVGRHFTPSNPSNFLALEVIVRTKMEKDPIMMYCHQKREEKRRSRT